MFIIATGFAKTISFAKMADFQNCLISGIFGVFSSIFFVQNDFNVVEVSFFSCFWQLKFLSPTDHFAKDIALEKTIAFAGWSTLKIVSFLALPRTCTIMTSAHGLQ